MDGVHVQEQCSLDDQPHSLAVQSVQAISLTDEVASAAQRAVLFTQGQARKLCTEGKARRLLREEASKEAHHRLYMWPHADLYVARPDL